MRKKITKVVSQRQLRVGEEIKHIIAQTLLREEFLDTRLKIAYVMVTEVQINNDFSLATVFIQTLGIEDVNKAVDLLNEHKGFFRKKLGAQLRLRITPDIRFFKDESFEQSAKIKALLNDPKVKADLNK